MTHTMVARTDGMTVAQLRRILAALPDHALICSGERVVKDARIAFGYDKVDPDAPTLILQFTDPAARGGKT